MRTITLVCNKCQKIFEAELIHLLPPACPSCGTRKTPAAWKAIRELEVMFGKQASAEQAAPATN